MENVKENKMGIMPMTKLILTMSLPAIFSMTIMAMYNVVDSILSDSTVRKDLMPLHLLIRCRCF